MKKSSPYLRIGIFICAAAVLGAVMLGVLRRGEDEVSKPAADSGTSVQDTSSVSASGIESSTSVQDRNAVSERNLDDEFASIIESNKEKLEDPIDYGPKFCTEYVSTQNDIEVHKAVLAEIKVLSDELCSGAESDYEMVRRIAYWVADNIYYNQVAAETSVDSDTISLETVLSTKNATCAGYSNMFSALCNMQGLYCINIRGGTAFDVFDADTLSAAPMNHEWNAVMIDGEWVFVDTTWISQNVYLGYAVSRSEEFLDRYFDMSLEVMSYEHRIDLVDHRDFAASVNAFDETGRWSE